MSNFSYEQWFDFTLGSADEPSKLTTHRYPGTVENLLQHCLTFFKTCDDAVLSRIPYARASEVLWALPSIDGYLGILGAPDLDFQLRAELARAHYPFFARIFMSKDYGMASFAWWERLPGASYLRHPPVHDDRGICIELFDAIQKILYLPSEICQECALHGINEIGPWVIPNDRAANANVAAIVHRFLQSDV